MERYLNDPGLQVASRRVKKLCLLEYVEENILDDVFRFSEVVQNTNCDSEYQSGVLSKENLEGVRIICGETNHEFDVIERLGFERGQRASAAPSVSTEENG